MLSMEKTVSVWAVALTWSQPVFSKIAATPRAPAKAKKSPRWLRISSKASASSLIHSMIPSGSPLIIFSPMSMHPPLQNYLLIS
jgi:hypothetical protein